MAQLEKIAAKRSRVHTQYKTKDGALVPGVTTALGVLNKAALVNWANALGLQGIVVSKYVDALAEIGTIAHAMILSHHQKTPFDTKDLPGDLVDKAENCILSYYEWERHHTVEPILCETSLISEIWRYGGSVDLVAKIDGVVTLCDYKSSKALYDEHIFQVAGYYQLLKENGYQIEAVRILRVGRDETEGFTDRPVTSRELSIGMDIFNACLVIYEKKKQLKAGQ